MESDLRVAALRWLENDPDADTRKELSELLASDANAAELADRFGADLAFGTAGLRGVIGAGPNRMNVAVVHRATYAVAQVLLAQVPDAATRGVVIGYDGRHKSSEFAQAAAATLAACGIRALLFADVGPTPLLAFAVLHLRAAGGIMITASHNPPEYNGYKLYWANGAQIVPPIDDLVAHAITQAPNAKTIAAMVATGAGEIVPVEANVERDYLAGVLRVAQTSAAKDLNLKIVYTALHGVGAKLVLAALAQAGYSAVDSVGEQEHPDGNFPTVAFPNPEEKGAMDLAFQLAKEAGAHLVIANDPDADRLSLAAPDRNGQYKQLTGNQVGVLLGNHVLELNQLTNPLLLNSCVSSPMLGAIARAHNAAFEETLTGFKWIANRAIEREANEGLHFIFGYEEALGYTIGNLVRDKDGISAALFAAELTATLRKQGHTLWDELDRLTRRYGLYASSQVNVVRKGLAGAAELNAMMDRLRMSPPSAIAGLAITAFADFSVGTRVAAGVTTKLALPPSNVLVYELAGGHRIIARPSGTEPKAKFYFDVCEQVDASEAIEAAQVRAAALLERLQTAFSELAGAK
jgi:phosphomannomutase